MRTSLTLLDVLTRRRGHICLHFGNGKNLPTGFAVTPARAAKGGKKLRSKRIAKKRGKFALRLIALKATRKTARSQSRRQRRLSGRFLNARAASRCTITKL